MEVGDDEVVVVVIEEREVVVGAAELDVVVEKEVEVRTDATVVEFAD